MASDFHKFQMRVGMFGSRKQQQIKRTRLVELEYRIECAVQRAKNRTNISKINRLPKQEIRRN